MEYATKILLLKKLPLHLLHDNRLTAFHYCCEMSMEHGAFPSSERLNSEHPLSIRNLEPCPLYLLAIDCTRYCDDARVISLVRNYCFTIAAFICIQHFFSEKLER